MRVQGSKTWLRIGFLHFGAATASRVCVRLHRCLDYLNFAAAMLILAAVDLTLGHEHGPLPFGTAARRTDRL